MSDVPTSDEPQIDIQDDPGQPEEQSSSAVILGTDLYTVTLVSGHDLQVQTEKEKNWFEETKQKYLEETSFKERTDQQDLDRLLTMELMIFRWNQHLAAGCDYQGLSVDEERLRRNVKEQSDAINKLKTTMSLTKQARDDAAVEGNLAQYITDLKARAKAFGIHREKQLTVALRLMNQLSAVVESFERSDEEERRKLGYESLEDIFTWIRNVMLPEFREVDEHFREKQQRYWIRDM